MAKKSRDKGARFERKVAQLFSDFFERNIRRTPNLLHRNPDDIVGGRIKSDLYDPENNDTFYYFVECKYHQTFTFNQLMLLNGKLFNFLSKASKECDNSKVPIVVFKGGHFLEEMVLYSSVDNNRIFKDETPPFFLNVGQYGDLCIVKLIDFLTYCEKVNLTDRLSEKIAAKFKIKDEDDGYHD